MLGRLIETSEAFKLFAPVRLNIACFTLAGSEPTETAVKELLGRLRDGGEAFLTPIMYNDVPSIRAAFSD